MHRRPAEEPWEGDAIDDIAASLKGSLRRLNIATVFLYLIVIGAVVLIYRKEDRTQTALCALRVDVEKRIESSQNFLLENPHGTPGISEAVIRSSIANSQRTVKALSGLTCPG